MKTLKWILISLAGLLVLVFVFYAEEDGRGKHGWESYKRQLEAKGEKLDWRAFVPSSVPDDQNFFCAPIFTNMLNGKIVMNPWHSDGSPNLHDEKFGYLGGQGRVDLTDLKQFQESYRNPTNTSLAKEFPIAPQPQTPAKDVLFALSKLDSAVEELRQASQRPYANVPLNYEDGFNAATPLLPILANLKRCTQVLQLRAIAELADGQNAKALDDVKLLLYLDNSLRSSPFLISHLVRMAIMSITLNSIWQGLAQHQWSDEQLIALDRELAGVDFVADYGFIMRGERAFEIASFENQQRTREVVSSKVDAEGNYAGMVTNKLTVMPRAYFYQNELAFARMHQQWILPLVDTDSHIISPEAFRRATNAVYAQMKHYSPYETQALMLFPALSIVAKKTAAIQSSIDLARVACALERYRLSYNAYPDTLDALTQQFIKEIPHDIINGLPLHYRLTDGGQFILYSVGWNDKDDGGVVALKANGGFASNNGDWVWEYPPK